MVTTVDTSSTRQESTIFQYRKNYSRLERMARKSYDIASTVEVSPQQVAAVFLDNESGWAQATARLYRASLACVFDEMNSIAGEEARALMLRTDEDPEQREQRRKETKARRKQRQRSSPRTGAKKSKSISREDMDRLRAALHESSRKNARATMQWFLSGALTGLRPSEWQFAQINFDEKNEPVLVVKNAKNTNGRAHGETRTIRLGKLSEADLSVIEEHLNNVHTRVDTKSFKNFYHECRKLLKDIVKRLWPRRLKRPSLYTARHQFGADAKNAFGPIAVAALMGHASTETAYQHYGKKHTGRSGITVEPSEPDMKAVAKRNPDYIGELGAINSSAHSIG